ncbi:two-component sensor histidine kinase [Pseudactinotalea sp. HY158]|nr:two-component sensor histidine kinase [Pseudactinotalea sp. HY158]
MTRPSDRRRLEGMSTWRRPRERLAGGGARKWFLGSFWGLAYLAVPITAAWVRPDFALDPYLTTALMLALGAAYVVLPPLLWSRGRPIVVAALAGFFALTCLAFPLMGSDTVWLWIYLPVIAAMTWQPRRFLLAVIAVVALAQAVVLWIAGDLGSEWFIVALTTSIGIMMFAFSLQIQAVRGLRAAQGEIARLAVADERERLARDIHDLLGHSLTVVTVKSELARRLVPSDPARAVAELDDIERTTRAALVDLRAAVTGYREVNLATELSAAHAALSAAGATPHLPDSTGGVDPDLRELFAWALRESVTNVIRHARARNCWVELEPRSITIVDDGRGGASLDAGSGGRGSGLAGLAARAQRSGAVLSVAERDHGGTLLTVTGVAP